ncbi:MAG: acyl-[Lachnospiraceae bacterium]|nr:acyl-[acyl-carrier-protein] thioesterase [Lachnospiraceae bacterium]
MYSFKSRVRFSETDINKKLSITGLMNYLQDCSIFQSEDIGAGFSYMKKTQKSWLLSAWNVEVLRRPDVAEEITIGTWPYDFKGIYGLRNFAIFDKDGNYLVKADSCWFLTSMETGRPVRPTAEDIAPYPTVEPRLDMEDLPRKITLPENLEEVGRISVMKHHLDINRHVNNVQYVDIACEAVPEGCEICGIRAEYRKAAVLGDVIVLKCAVDGDKYAVSLCAEDGSIFANVELKTMK